MKRLIYLTILISAVTLTGYWAGRKICMGMWPGTVNPSRNWYEGLKISPGQADFFRLEDAAFRRDADPLCMRICARRLEILSLIKTEKADSEKVFGKIAEVGTMQVELEKRIAAHILAVKSKLSPADQETYLARIRRELQASIRQSGFAKPEPSR